MNSKAMIAAMLLAASAVAAAADAPPGGGPPDGGPPGGRRGGMMRMSPEERFKQLDTNHDGKLSLAEFTAARSGMRGGGPGGPGGVRGPGEPGGAPGGPPRGGPGGGMMRMSPEERFKQLDTNKDGFVSLQEYVAGMPRRGDNGGR